MKIKSDFITNSSSSSFVVAVKTGTSQKLIEKLISESVKNWLLDANDDELEEVLGDINMYGGENERLEKASEYFAENIFDTSYSLDVDGWKITSSEASNDGGLVSNFMYAYLNHLDTEGVKTKSFN